MQMAKNKKITKKLLCEELGILHPTSPTSPTSTTRINSWGYIDIKNKILIEQLTKDYYIYNIKGKVKIVQLQFKCDCGTLITTDTDKPKCSCGNKLNSKDHQGLYIQNKVFKFNNKPEDPLYLTPSIQDIKDNILSFQKADDTQELFNEIENLLLTLFEFQNKEDSKLATLAILFSYVLPHFNSTFFIGIDSTKGHGKTTLLEILTILCRHGFLADVSPASIPRLKQKFDLNPFVDEIDQIKNSEDILGLMRRAQRRGNKYVRLNKTTLEAEIYDAFGFYCYSFRSMVEDALKQRTVMIRTPINKDSRLSIINLEKLPILKALHTKIFLWYIKNIFVFCSGCSEVVDVVSTSTQEPLELRTKLYDRLTEDFDPEEKKLIGKLFGRNAEIGYLIIKTAKFLKLNITKEIKKIMEEKQEEEETPDSYYFDLIKEVYIKAIKEDSKYLLKKGEFSGWKCFPKTPLYYKLVHELKEHNLMGIGMSKYNSLLKDIGFIPRYNIKNERFSDNPNPVMSLIFTKDVLKKLGIDDEQVNIAIEKI